MFDIELLNDEANRAYHSVMLEIYREEEGFLTKLLQKGRAEDIDIIYGFKNNGSIKIPHRYVCRDPVTNERRLVNWGSYRDFVIVQDENLTIDPTFSSAYWDRAHVAAKWIPGLTTLEHKDPVGEAVFEIYKHASLRNADPELRPFYSNAVEFAGGSHGKYGMCYMNRSSDILGGKTTKQLADHLRREDIDPFYQDKERLGRIIAERQAEEFLESLRQPVEARSYQE